MLVQREKLPAYGYFAVTGFDMCGGDLQIMGGINSFDQALGALKAKINYCTNYCGRIGTDPDNESKYIWYLKNKQITNPTENKVQWHKGVNIFWGRRLVPELADKYAGAEYVLVDGLDMWGGDLQKWAHQKSFDEALQKVLNGMKGDPNLCGMVLYISPNNYYGYIKDPKQCNPSKTTKYHMKCTTIFIAKQS